MVISVLSDVSFFFTDTITTIAITASMIRHRIIAGVSIWITASGLLSFRRRAAARKGGSPAAIRAAPGNPFRKQEDWRNKTAVLQLYFAPILHKLRNYNIIVARCPLFAALPGGRNAARG